MIIKVGITKSQLIGDIGPALRHRLRESLSYKDQVQMIRRGMYKKKYGTAMKGWNGSVYLISDKLYLFDSGFLPRVREILKRFSIEWAEMPMYKMPESFKITPAKQPKLWEHQDGAVEAIKKYRSGIIQIGTGGGKTITAVEATAQVGQLPVLFVVNRLKLLKQAHNAFASILGEKIGFIGNGEMSFGRFNVATIHTICSILKIPHKQDEDDDVETVSYDSEQINMMLKLLSATRFLIVDECHHASSDMYLKLKKFVPNAVYRIGLSATPFRTDGTDILLEAAFGPVIYKISSSELIRKKKLARPYITFIGYEDPKTQLFPVPTEKQKKAKGYKAANYQTVYNQCIIENELYNNKVAQVALANAFMGRLTLVSVTRIVHGNNIMQEIRKLNPEAKVEFLNGENKNRLGEDKVIQDFVDRKIEILISTLMDEGVDIPAIEVGINAGGGASPSKALQFAGRAMRLFEGKKCCYIYDFIHPYVHLYDHTVARLNILQSEEEFKIDSIEMK